MSSEKPATKKCSKCGEVKPRDAFWRDNGTASGLFSHCKACGHEYYEANKQRLLAQNKAYRERNKERVATRQREYRERNRERAVARAKAHHIKKKYGLTVEQYEEVIARGCAICGDHAKRMHLDHDHTTGRVRDALCQPCNHMIGNARDKIEILERGVLYLTGHHNLAAARAILSGEEPPHVVEPPPASLEAKRHHAP